ncbi:hypothetical protein LHFGNBLO_006587 (plasmid) [Mesorhizobium sp. AR10]|uniref:hypothetical protein n=1 Tax=Mesorhizobium sp. AR10 TaxID=2865839 RepID=UPI002160361D|nr:hypothetical protein [Mesorhizobium sp. AR10]UVK35723.1 hypothetical protein LHFGNBLO_006587 [Mesorhizobium sp. AR10]
MATSFTDIFGDHARIVIDKARVQVEPKSALQFREFHVVIFTLVRQCRIYSGSSHCGVGQPQEGQAINDSAAATHPPSHSDRPVRLIADTDGEL